MELITFDKTNKKPVIRNSIPFLTVNAKGKFNFSQGARRLLQLTDGNRAVLHQDKKYRNDWYLQITNEDRGYKIVLSTTDSRFTCNRAAGEIFKSIGRKPEKMSFVIEERPIIRTDGTLFFAIKTNKTV